MGPSSTSTTPTRTLPSTTSSRSSPSSAVSCCWSTAARASSASTRRRRSTKAATAHPNRGKGQHTQQDKSNWGGRVDQGQQSLVIKRERERELMWWWWEPVTRANQVIYHFTASIHFFYVE